MTTINSYKIPIGIVRNIKFFLHSKIFGRPMVFLESCDKYDQHTHVNSTNPRPRVRRKKKNSLYYLLLDSINATTHME